MELYITNITLVTILKTHCLFLQTLLQLKNVIWKAQTHFLQWQMTREVCLITD